MRPNEKYPGGIVLETVGEIATVAQAEQELVGFLEQEPTPIAGLLEANLTMARAAAPHQNPDLETPFTSRWDKSQGDLILLILQFAAQKSEDPLLAAHAQSMLDDYSLKRITEQS